MLAGAIRQRPFCTPSWMKVLRIFFAITVCAVLLLLGSCSKTELPDQQMAASPNLENVQDQSPVPDSADVIPPLAPDATGETEAEPSADPPRPKVEDRKSSAAARAKGEINFDDLKFDLEKDAAFEDQLLTDEIRELDGSKVKLRGYILPSTLFSETNISQFVLVRDNQECCFGPGAALFDCVMVQMVPGKTTDFVTRPVTVEGTFVIDTDTYRYPPGLSPTGATHMAVFRIEGESVQ